MGVYPPASSDVSTPKNVMPGNSPCGARRSAVSWELWEAGAILAWHSALRIWRCPSSGGNCSWDPISWPCAAGLRPLWRHRMDTAIRSALIPPPPARFGTPFLVPRKPLSTLSCWQWGMDSHGRGRAKREGGQASPGWEAQP